MFRRFDDVENRLGKVDNRLDENTEGIALQTPHVPINQRFRLSGGWGNFEGENALAESGAFRFNQHFQVASGVGFGVDHDTFGARAGGTLTWYEAASLSL